MRLIATSRSLFSKVGVWAGVAYFEEVRSVLFDRKVGCVERGCASYDPRDRGRGANQFCLLCGVLFFSRAVRLPLFGGVVLTEGS